jgi:hypothetical protein
MVAMAPETSVVKSEYCPGWWPAARRVRTSDSHFGHGALLRRRLTCRRTRLRSMTIELDLLGDEVVRTP